jgi:hypothetical protein
MPVPPRILSLSNRPRSLPPPGTLLPGSRRPSFSPTAVVCSSPHPRTYWGEARPSPRIGEPSSTQEMSASYGEAFPAVRSTTDEVPLLTYSIPSGRRSMTGLLPPRSPLAPSLIRAPAKVRRVPLPGIDGPNSTRVTSASEGEALLRWGAPAMRSPLPVCSTTQPKSPSLVG